MNKLILSIITFLLLSCSNNTETKFSDKNENQQATVAEPAEETIEVDLKTIMDEFDFGKDHFKANKKYVGKLLKVAGRTSGVGEDGTLTMQVAPTNEAIWCYGLPDDFLLQIKKNDIVEITGRFNRTDKGMITVSSLENCNEYKKISK